MLQFGVLLTALALLFSLTALALAASGQLRHPYRVVGVLAATLAVGLALLMN